MRKFFEAEKDFFENGVNTVVDFTSDTESFDPGSLSRNPLLGVLTPNAPQQSVAFIDFDPNSTILFAPVTDPVGAEFIPADPLFSQQLHLRNTNAGQLDINVETVWDDYTGAGVQVTVFDVGYDYNHVDLAANYNSAIDYDYTSNDFDPIATGGDNHGTAVIGIIGAVQGDGDGIVEGGL